MSRLDGIPHWIQEITPYVKASDPVPPNIMDEMNKLIEQINFLKGSYVGHSARVDELEQQLKIAFEYQREVDARLIDLHRTSVGHDYDEIRSINGETQKIKGAVIETFSSPEGLAERIRKGQ